MGLFVERGEFSTHSIELHLNALQIGVCRSMLSLDLKERLLVLGAYLSDLVDDTLSFGIDVNDALKTCFERIVLLLDGFVLTLKLDETLQKKDQNDDEHDHEYGHTKPLYQKTCGTPRSAEYVNITHHVIQRQLTSLAPNARRARQAKHADLWSGRTISTSSFEYA
ncbi:MAG TPA: hypothetical protein PK156_28940 [Polyangium sp.]|nr:hypothetical protein [Polyangium sp.]